MMRRSPTSPARISHLALAVSVVALVLVGSTREAPAQEDNAAMAANRGLRIGLGPILLLPSREGGPYGGGLMLDGRYGIKAGPTVLAPGGRLSGYVQSSRFLGTAMPTFRITLPVGPLAPYILGGVGGGWISNPSEGGVALLGGGGLMIHFGRTIALGVEATYQTITGTEFQSVAIGPSIAFGG
jgi:hypothetical protein